MSISSSHLPFRGSLVCSVFIFFGAVISAAGTNNDSFKLVLTGRIVLGLGSTVIETCTSKVGSSLSFSCILAAAYDDDHGMADTGALVQEERLRLRVRR